MRIFSLIICGRVVLLIKMCYCQIMVWEFIHADIADMTVTLFRS